MKDPVLSRRSIRSYRKQEISREDLDHILAGGDAAACGKGLRSWHFYVIKRREILDSIPNVHPYSRMIPEAPVALLVCAVPSIEPIEGYWAQNCSAATENLLISANCRDIGSVWLGVYPNKDRMDGIRDLLNLPVEHIPFSIVVLGHPAEEKEHYSGYLKERVSFME